MTTATSATRLGDFWKFWAKILVTKVAQILNDILGYFDTWHFLSKNFCVFFLGNFSKKWSNFYSNIWSHWRRCRVAVQRPKLKWIFKIFLWRVSHHCSPLLILRDIIKHTRTPERPYPYVMLSYIKWIYSVPPPSILFLSLFHSFLNGLYPISFSNINTML